MHLSTIGSGSFWVSETDTEISYKSVDINLVNKALNFVRGWYVVGLIKNDLINSFLYWISSIITSFVK